MPMWKESYRLGVDQIDREHIELFRITEELIRRGEQGATAQAYEETVRFLKDYVIYHFQNEESYQASIHYDGLEEHKKEHRQFTQMVLDYEKKLIENDFDSHTVKDLAGTLTAWLIYHVTDTDQKIVAGEKPKPDDRQFDLCVDLFSESALDVMETMAGFDRSQIRSRSVTEHQIQGDIFIEIELVGALSGRAVFGFSRDLALNLIRTMTMMELHELDELVQSALCELTNISCGSAATALAQRGILCDIKPPVISADITTGTEVNGVFIDTGSGGLEVVVLVEEEPLL